MAFEYEALIGHLFVVSGRSINTAPPGVLCEVAPKRAARGREADTFFVLVTPSGDNRASSKFYDNLAQLAAEQYFSSTGSVTSGLRNVFNTLNQNLFEHNQKPDAGRAYEANLTCAVLRGSDLIVGRIGPSVVLLRHDGKTVSIPDDLSDDEALFTEPLGVYPVPNPRMAQYRVANGTRLVLGDVSLADLDFDRMENTLLAQDLAGVLVGFKDLARLHCMLLVAEFVPPDAAEVDASIPVGESLAEIANSRSKPPPVEEAQASEAEAPAETPRRTRENPVERGARTGASRLLRGMGAGLGLASRVINHLLPPPEEGERRFFNSPAAAGAVVLLPVGVVMLVILIWLGATGDTAFEQCLDETLARAQSARAVPSSEVRTTLDLWAFTLQQASRCAELRPGDATIDGIRREGQEVIDSLNQITRRDAVPIASFVGAALTNIVLQGETLYVLDGNESLVHRVQLSGDGLSSLGEQTITAMRRGANVNGFTIADLIDIDFSTNLNKILALDTNGILVICDPALVLNCEAQQLIGADTWVNPVAFTSWNERIYVLDSGFDTGQIWRYDGVGGDFVTAPAQYFGTLRPNLTGAIDFGITRTGGEVYVLLADGLVQRFRGGEVQDFNFAGFPVGQDDFNSASAMYLDSSPVGQRLYILSRATRTIYETGLVGSFHASYQVQDPALFELVADVVVTNSPPVIYTVSGNAVLALRKDG